MHARARAQYKPLAHIERPQAARPSADPLAVSVTFAPTTPPQAALREERGRLMLPLSELSARSAAALGAVAARAKVSAAALGAAALTRRRSSLTEDWLGVGEGDNAGGAGGTADGGGEARAGGVAGAQQGELPSRGRPRRALSAGVLGTAPLHSAQRNLRTAPDTRQPAPRATRHAPQRHAPRAPLSAQRLPPRPPPAQRAPRPRSHRCTWCRGPTCDAARGFALLFAPPRRTRVHCARLARRLCRLHSLRLRLRFRRLLARALPG